MLKTNCYLCGADEPRVLFAQQGQDIYLELVSSTLCDVERNWVVCGRCGFVYRNPVLDNDELATLYNHYDKDVFESIEPDAYFDRIISLPPDLSENWQKIDWLVGNMVCRDKVKGPVAVLDIGCGGGTLLYTLGKRIRLGDVCGVELNTAYADLAARRLNATIRNEAYNSGAFDRSFDLLVCTKVLEHVPDPRVFLKKMAQDLSADGLLFLEVPDVTDLYTLPVEDDRFFIPHIYFFSANTLGELLHQSGFSAVESRVVKTHRRRSYLQILAVKHEQAFCSSPPFDDPVRLERLVAANIEHHNNGDALDE